MIGTPAADMMCLDVLKMRQSHKGQTDYSPVMCLFSCSVPSPIKFCFYQDTFFSTGTNNVWSWVGWVLPFDAHVSYGRGRGTNEDDAFLFACLCKLCVFWQKAISRVDRLPAQSHLYKTSHLEMWKLPAGSLSGWRTLAAPLIRTKKTWRHNLSSKNCLQ